jgi:hypothetical protein
MLRRDCFVAVTLDVYQEVQTSSRSLLNSRRGGFWLPEYRAFAIGPEELAISFCEIYVRDDVEALEKATPLFRDGLKRIEVWCGSRKVGDIPPRQNDVAVSAPIRDSA